MGKKPTKPLSRTVKYVAIGFILLCVVFTTGLTALNFYPGLAILPLASTAQSSPFCTVCQGVSDSSQVKLTQAAFEKKTLAELRPVRKDGAYKLWSTPY